MPAVQLPPTPGGSDGAAPAADRHGWAPDQMGNAGSGAEPSPAVGAAADYDEAYRHLSQLQLDGDENQQPGTHTATAAPMVSGSCAPLAAQPFGYGQQHMTVAQALDALHATPPTARQPLRFRDCPAGTVDLSQTYEVREQLGRGAVDGVVVRFAHHRATGEPVAIKCARPQPPRPATRGGADPTGVARTGRFRRRSSRRSGFAKQRRGSLRS